MKADELEDHTGVIGMGHQRDGSEVRRNEVVIIWGQF